MAMDWLVDMGDKRGRRVFRARNLLSCIRCGEGPCGLCYKPLFLYLVYLGGAREGVWGNDYLGGFWRVGLGGIYM